MLTPEKRADIYIGDNDRAKEYREDLIDIFSRFEKGFGTCISCDHGWLEILSNCHQSLKYIDPDYTIAQIKEKFGTLRYYAQLKHVDDDPDHDVKHHIFMAITSYWERQTHSTCEKCGGYGTSRGSTGWIHTYCDNCQVVYLNKIEKQSDGIIEEIAALTKAIEDREKRKRAWEAKQLEIKT